jgi:hypothetical protein
VAEGVWAATAIEFIGLMEVIVTTFWFGFTIFFYTLFVFSGRILGFDVIGVSTFCENWKLDPIFENPKLKL